MKNRFAREASPMPDELRALDAELSAIRYEERPSFGPELEAELAQAWVGLKSRRRTSVRPFAVAAVPWYRLRAEVVDRATGVVTGVPIRPAGEDGFRPTWDRFPAAGGLTSEFLTVALSDVKRGRHTLRIIVDVPEVGAGVVAQRDLDRREDPDQDWD
jgi:hypothetical protein